MTKNTDSKTTKTKKSATRATSSKKLDAKVKKVPAKAVVKTSKKPVVPAKASVVSQKISTVNIAALGAWNKWVALLYLAQAVALVVAAKTYALPVTVTYLAKDTFASQEGKDAVYAPAVRHLLDLNITYALVAILLVAAIVHGMYATIYKKRYEAELEAGVNRLRWASYGVVVSGITTVVALTIGLNDVMVIAPVIVLVLLSCLAGLAVEVYAQRKNRRRLALVIAGVAAVAPWALFATSISIAGVVSNDNLPAEAYGVVIAPVVALIMFAVAFILRFRGRGKWQQYMHAERSYSMVLFVLVTLVTWILFVGRMQP